MARCVGRAGRGAGRGLRAGPISHGPGAKQVLLKIIKHDEAEHDSLATGVLLGLDVYEEMQVTNCFALPADSRDLRGFQLSMLSRLQEVNADYNMVGWYMCGSSGSLVSQDVISRQFVMQDELPSKAVLLVYDPSMTAQGTVGLRAFRLTETFMELYREGDFRLPRCGPRPLFWPPPPPRPYRALTASCRAAWRARRWTRARSLRSSRSRCPTLWCCRRWCTSSRSHTRRTRASSTRSTSRWRPTCSGRWRAWSATWRR